MDKVFTERDSFQEWIDLLEAHNACDDGLVWARSLGDISLKRGLLLTKKHPDWKDWYGIWALTVVPTSLDDQMFEILANTICKNPRQAAFLYTSVPNLTIHRRNFLLRKFHSKVKGGPSKPLYPTIERELHEKKVIPGFRKTSKPDNAIGAK